MTSISVIVWQSAACGFSSSKLNCNYLWIRSAWSIRWIMIIAMSQYTSPVTPQGFGLHMGTQLLTWHSTQSQEERSNWRKFPLIELNKNNKIKWRPRAWIWPAKCLCHIGGKAFLGFEYQLSGRDGLITSQHRLVAVQKAKINLLNCFLGHEFFY